MMKDFSKIVKLFSLEDFDCREVEGHEGARNRIFVCSKGDEKKFVLRISATGDRTEKDYLAETEFVHYLAANGAPVADVVPSLNVPPAKAKNIAIFRTITILTKHSQNFLTDAKKHLNVYKPAKISE